MQLVVGAVVLMAAHLLLAAHREAVALVQLVVQVLPEFQVKETLAVKVVRMV